MFRIYNPISVVSRVAREVRAIAILLYLPIPAPPAKKKVPPALKKVHPAKKKVEKGKGKAAREVKKVQRRVQRRIPRRIPRKARKDLRLAHLLPLQQSPRRVAKEARLLLVSSNSDSVAFKTKDSNEAIVEFSLCSVASIQEQ
jgi:hypothetical protein